MSHPPLRFELPPYRLSGTVVGALLNDPAQLAALGDAVHAAPHKAPPHAPVLEVKPRHTLAGDGAAVELPAGEAALEVGASLGIVIGATACRVDAARALSHVAGYLVALDFSLPLAAHYRPAVRLKARDGFCPLGPAVVPASAVADPDALGVDVSVDGAVAHRHTTAGRVRGVAALIADVSEFMTLQPGDVLLLGRAHGAPLARAGQTVAARIEGVGTLRARLVAEALA
ncbi:fumarylacetoacetate hydrolase family protein [Piscinibacter sp.]|uniref:fumarylacetoacetate hydrolase family protein n=1 Tax=Piscinibacter sp. TaxID=1903157 RepID=UPI0039E6DD67